MTEKKCIKTYPRNNTDWKYINFLEDKIKILEEDLKLEKLFHSKIRQQYLYATRQTIPQLKLEISNLKHQRIPQLENELKQSDLIKAKLFDERSELKNKLAYYKQSLL